MRSVTERSERFSKSACDWHSSVVRISDRAPLVGRKADEQRDLATEELVGPLTRTAGEDGANGCTMPARGSNPELVSTSEAARSRWSGTMEGAPGAETATPNRVVAETSWLRR